jgi:voltage-gated potassium channel
MISEIDHFLRNLLATGPDSTRRSIIYRLVLITAILASAAIAIIDTVPNIWGDYRPWVDRVEVFSLILMGVDYALRLRQSALGTAIDEPGWASIRRYLFSPYGIFDFLAVVPFLLGAIFGLPADGNTILGILRFLKLARYSPALETLAVVVLTEIKPLTSALFIVVLLAISAATALYFAERTVNTNFATVPDALWWAIITLTTVGYGDVVPMTTLGKALNAGVAVLGLCMFALPASILATGFAEEMRRLDFMATWRLVAKVPLFTRLHAGQIAEIAAMLRPQRAVRGEAIVREGELGDSMYFIVNGVVEGQSQGRPFTLRAGDFFGEIAMIQRLPRTATVRAQARTQLLVLEARDFQRFVTHYPDLMDIIRETARSRMGLAPDFVN